MVQVQDVIGASELHLAVVGCPHPERTVRWVATNEMADPRPFLEGGELLLFTGLEMDGWGDDRWWDYVDRLMEAEISALALAVGITHADVPQALVGACLHHGLNLLTVPMETSFVSISQAVARLLEASDRMAARHAVDMQRRLAQAARRGDAAQAITDELAPYVAGSVWVMSPSGQTLHHAGSTASRHADALAEISVEIEDLASRGLGASAAWASQGQHTVLQSIGLRSPADAFLAVRTPQTLSDYQRTAVLTALSMLTLDFATRAEQRQATQALARRAIDLLVAGEGRAAALVLRAAHPDWDLLNCLPRRAAALRIAGPRDRLLALLIAIEDGRWDPVRVAAASDDNARELDVVVPESVLTRIVEDLDAQAFRVGVGMVGDLPQFGASMRSASQALARTSEPSRVVWWEQLRADRLGQLVDEHTRRVLAEELVLALARSSVGEQELLRVAASFLRHHGRMNVVAGELGMHRNTARARVQELERLLQCNLQDPAARAHLWIALEAVTSEVG